MCRSHETDEIPDFGKIENRISVLVGQLFALFYFYTLSGAYLSMLLKKPDFSKMKVVLWKSEKTVSSVILDFKRNGIIRRVLATYDITQ